MAHWFLSNFWYVRARGPVLSQATADRQSFFSPWIFDGRVEGGERECTLCVFQPHSLSVHCTVYKTQRLLLAK